MENIGINITKRKDGRYMKKFIRRMDVNFQNKILHIRRTVQRIGSNSGNRKTKIVISTPKSATSFRDIVISDMLIKYFKVFRSEADFFILSDLDKPVEPHIMQYSYKKILQSAEIENHNFHKLRHTFESIRILSKS